MEKIIPEIRTIPTPVTEQGFDVMAQIRESRLGRKIAVVGAVAGIAIGPVASAETTPASNQAEVYTNDGLSRSDCVEAVLEDFNRPVFDGGIDVDLPKGDRPARVVLEDITKPSTVECKGPYGDNSTLGVTSASVLQRKSKDGKSWVTATKRPVVLGGHRARNIERIQRNLKNSEQSTAFSNGEQKEYRWKTVTRAFSTKIENGKKTVQNLGRKVRNISLQY